MPPPIATEKCIRGCGKPAGATPWLCLFCLKKLIHEWVIFTYETSNPELHEKRVMNKLQRKTRKAFKRHIGRES